MNFISTVIDWINKDTKGLYESRLQAVVIRCTSMISIVYYVFLAILFLINEQWLLGLYDIAGSTVLMYAVFLTYNKRVKQSFWIYNLAMMFLVVFQIVYLGWGIGAQYSLFLLIIVSMFTTYYTPVFKFLVALFYAVLFCILYLYVQFHMPYVVFLNNIDYFISIITIIHSFGCLVVAGFYFSAKSMGMEKKLVEYNKNLERLAFFDPLTGLYNRRQTLTFINKQVSALEKMETGAFTVVISDIDFFKKVNDVYGHDCGDIVLKEVARILKKTVDKRGLASRWGGEEFLMIFPGADKDTVVGHVESLIDTIRKMEINYNGYVIKLTMSFGVCQYEKGMTADEVIKNADVNLYEAKKTGRDRVVY